MEYSLAVIAAGLNLRSTRPPLPHGFLNCLFRNDCTAKTIHCEVSSASLDGNRSHNPSSALRSLLSKLCSSRVPFPSGVWSSDNLSA
jgi:hypothetical protein